MFTAAYSSLLNGNMFTECSPADKRVPLNMNTFTTVRWLGTR
jgi:hypothetical protein